MASSITFKQKSMRRIYFQKRCFNNNMKKYLLITLLIVWTMCQTVIAQTAEFVPKSLSLITVDSFISSYKDFYADNSQRISALDMLRKRNNIDIDAVTGSISYEETRTRLHFQYGLFASINLGITVPYLSSRRNSNLSLNDPAEAAFVDSLGDAEASGLGDTEIWGLWRLFYTDQADFQLGLKLIDDNAPLNNDVAEKMPLGSGSKELSLFLRWYLFSIRSSLMTFLEIEHIFIEDAKIKSINGQEILKQQSNNFNMKFEVSAHSEQLGYGGGARMQSIGSQKLDGASQNDGYLSYGLSSFLSYGNRYLLEKNIINNPWETRIELEKVFVGSNVPEIQSLSLQFITYF